MAVNKNFVVKNGLEVRQDLILADATNTTVGIGTSVPQYTLDEAGGIGVTNIYVAGSPRLLVYQLTLGSHSLMMSRFLVLVRLQVIYQLAVI